MKKSVLIIGVGRLGSHLAEKMQDLGHDVMVLDNKEERINRLASRIADARIAEYTHEEVLAALDIPSFDICFVTVGDNLEASIITTITLKKLGAKYVASRARDDVQCEILKKSRRGRDYLCRRRDGGQTRHTPQRQQHLRLYQPDRRLCHIRSAHNEGLGE